MARELRAPSTACRHQTPIPLGLPRRYGITEARDRPKPSQQSIRQTRRRGLLRFGAGGKARVPGRDLRTRAKKASRGPTMSVIEMPEGAG